MKLKRSAIEQIKRVRAEGNPDANVLFHAAKEIFSHTLSIADYNTLDDQEVTEEMIQACCQKLERKLIELNRARRNG